MKRLRKLLTILLALALLTGLCACGSSPAAEKPAETAAPAAEPTPAPAEEPTPEPAAEPTPEPTPEPAAAFPVEGDYALFAVENQGSFVDVRLLNMSGSISLLADGTGKLSSGASSAALSSWSLDGETLSLVDPNGEPVSGTLRDGILTLDIQDGYSMYFAAPGADTAPFFPSSKLYAYVKELNPSALHLAYSRHIDYQDATETYDVHVKDAVYYSSRTTQVSGYENTLVTFYRDGKVYNLYPDKMSGTLVTSVSLESLAGVVARLDPLFSVLLDRSLQRDFTEETREVGGVSYAVEVFPAPSAYQGEAAVYFDGSGRPVYVQELPAEGASVSVGEVFYTVGSIDGAANEALFDISGYAIG